MVKNKLDKYKTINGILKKKNIYKVAQTLKALKAFMALK